MSPAARFILAWIGASAPLLWLGEMVLESYLRWVWDRLLVHQSPTGYWIPVIPYTAAVATATAVLQSRVLARRGRRCPAWIGAALAGHLLAALIFVSIMSQWKEFTGSFGAVKLPGSWFRAVSVLFAVSCSLAIASAEAWALRRLSPRMPWPLWIVGRVGLALGMLTALLAFGFSPLGPVAGFSYFEPLGRGLAAGAWHLVSAAGTAWLLERLAFKDEP